MSKQATIMIALVVVGAPLLGLTATAVTDDEANWGLCQAHDASEQGNESSNGTVHDTPAFQGINESTCENETAPWNGTAGEEHVPDDTPDEDDNPSEGAPGEDEHPDEDDNEGEEYEDDRSDRP